LFFLEKISKKTIIDDYPCHKNVVFSKDWKLVEFVLAEKSNVLEMEFPKGTEVSYYKDFIRCFFGRDTKIQGYWCNGNHEKWYSTGILTTFYLSGKLKGFFPIEDVEIDGVMCKASPFAGVRLYENGKLKECKLSQDQIINGKEYKKNTRLKFDKEGIVISAK